MAYYLVRAKAKMDLTALHDRITSGEIARMQPFGRGLEYSLQNVRQESDGWLVWEEEDYCRPPLAMERAAVLDTYFTDLSVEKVEEGVGWALIESLPLLWKTES